MFKNLILVFTVSTVFLIFLEIVLRTGGFGFPNFYQPDPDIGFSLRPGAEGWYVKEGKSFVRINEYGRRDPGFTASKPQDTLRVAFLGDSFVLGLEVPEEAGMANRLVNRLETCPGASGRRVEIFNFGVAGYGTAQELLTLQRRVWQYAPDVILLGFFAGNDVRNNSRALQNDELRPYFVLREGALHLDNSFRDSSGYRFRNSTAAAILYGLVNRVYVLQLLDESRRQLRFFINRFESESETSHNVGQGTEFLRPPKTDEWRDAWRVTEALIAKMHRETRARGAVFAVAAINSAIQVHPDEKVRAAFRQGARLKDLQYADRRIAALARRLDFPVIDLASPLRLRAVQRQEYLHGFANTELGVGHYNRRGHAAAADVIASTLCRILKPVTVGRAASIPGGG